MAESGWARVAVRMAVAVLAALCTITPAPALAQETAGARLTIGAGPQLAPDYIGSDSYTLGATGRLRVGYLRLPGGLEFGNPDPSYVERGFGLRGSFRYIGSRRAGDNSELAGLEDVDQSLEIGLGLGYEERNWRAFADARYGVIGHSAWVGEFGADAIVHPTDQLVVNFGPRVGWGSDRFMNTYFGVDEAEAARAPRLDEFNPSSGLYSVGAELGARYYFSDRWGVEGALTYDRLIEDAGDSPIVGLGSRDQFGARVLITRSISLGF